MRDPREDARMLALQRPIGNLQLGARLRAPYPGVEWVIFMIDRHDVIVIDQPSGAFYHDDEATAVEHAMKWGAVRLATWLTEMKR